MMVASVDTNGHEIGHVYKHLKSGGYYRLISSALIESTLSEVAVYQSLVDHKVWVRPWNEFNDGRFERSG